MEPPLAIRDIRQDSVHRDLFRISPEVMERFPELKIGVAILEGVSPQKEHPKLNALIDETQRQLRARLSEVNLGDIERIKDYREIYRGFGVDPRSRVPSAEALLHRLVYGKGLYRINTVVDAYNLTSAEFHIPMATYDLDKVSLPVELRYAQRGETHVPIGARHPDILEQGELVYADQSRILCRDFNWRDSDHTKITTSTRDLILFADGAQSTSTREIEHAIDLAASRIRCFSGGTLRQQAVLYKTQ